MQLIGAEKPTADHDPTGLVWQVIEDVALSTEDHNPALHLAQDEEPSEDQDPAEHERQLTDDVEPVVDDHVPALQLLHTWEPDADQVPAPQEVHKLEVAATIVEKVPAEHEEQSALPALE